MSKSSHQIAVTGVDQTAKTFQSIQARAIATGRRISSIMGGAIAAAGAYLSFRSIKGAVDELGKMSDLAMKAGTSVEFLTKSATAFKVAGLDVTAESITRALQYMQKNTGQQGEDAFYETVKNISQIPDAAERARAAVQVFGRSGLEMLPLVNNGEEAIEKMRLLASVMPGVSTAAANAGDAASDALTIFGKGVQTTMLKVVAKIAGWFGAEFPGGVRAGALAAANWIEIFAKRAGATFRMLKDEIGASFQFWKTVAQHGWSTAVAEHELTHRQISEDFTSRMMELDDQRNEYLDKLKELSIDDLANPFGNRSAMESAGDALGTAAMKRISNQLILAGSNAERRLSVLGPTYQNEQRKQTEYLKTIAKNTEKTAENTEGGEDLNVLDP